MRPNMPLDRLPPLVVTALSIWYVYPVRTTSDNNSSTDVLSRPEADLRERAFKAFLYRIRIAYSRTRSQ